MVLRSSPERLGQHRFAVAIDDRILVAHRERKGDADADIGRRARDRLGFLDQRHGAARPGVMDHHRRAAGPRRTRQRRGRGRDRDRPACRARSAGSSFPAACRSRRTTTRSARAWSWALTKAGRTRERGPAAGGAPSEIEVMMPLSCRSTTFSSRPRSGPENRRGCNFVAMIAHLIAERRTHRSRRLDSSVTLLARGR